VNTSEPALSEAHPDQPRPEPKPAEPVPAAPATLGRLRGLYLLGLGALALPGVLIGLPLGFALRPRWDTEITTLLGGVAAFCAMLTLWLAWRQGRSPESGSRLSAAVLVASAPAVPLLMACALWRRSDALALLLPLALIAFGLGWAMVQGWATEKSAVGEQESLVFQPRNEGASVPPTRPLAVRADPSPPQGERG
jgi:hypothetical protein